MMGGPLAALGYCLGCLQLQRFSWEEKLAAPLIAAPNGDCANEKTKDRANKLDYRIHV